MYLSIVINKTNEIPLHWVVRAVFSIFVYWSAKHMKNSVSQIVFQEN